MRSYKDLAEEAGVTVEAVRDAMGRAERHEIPYTRMYDDFRNPPRPFGPGRYGRAETAYDVVWVVRDQWGRFGRRVWAHARGGRAGRVAPGRMIRATPQGAAGQGVWNHELLRRNHRAGKRGME